MGAVGGLKHAWANVAASQTDNTLNGSGTAPAAVVGFKIVVKQAIVSQGGTASGGVTFNSKPAGSGTAVTATFTPAANGTLNFQSTDYSWFETNVGEGLTVTTGAGATAGVMVTYQYVAGP